VIYCRNDCEPPKTKRNKIFFDCNYYHDFNPCSYKEDTKTWVIYGENFSQTDLIAIKKMKNNTGLSHSKISDIISAYIMYSMGLFSENEGIVKFYESKKELLNKIAFNLSLEEAIHREETTELATSAVAAYNLLVNEGLFTRLVNGSFLENKISPAPIEKCYKLLVYDIAKREEKIHLIKEDMELSSLPPQIKELSYEDKDTYYDRNNNIIYSIIGEDYLFSLKTNYHYERIIINEPIDKIPESLLGEKNPDTLKRKLEEMFGELIIHTFTDSNIDFSGNKVLIDTNGTSKTVFYCYVSGGNNVNDQETYTNNMKFETHVKVFEKFGKPNIQVSGDIDTYVEELTKEKS
jgi:hypothetical protein